MGSQVRERHSGKIGTGVGLGDRCRRDMEMWEGRGTRVNGEGRQGRERDKGLEETSMELSVERPGDKRRQPSMEEGEQD